METRSGKVVVVVRPGRRTGPVLAWLRLLLPAAVLLVSPAALPAAGAGAGEGEGDAIVVEADGIDSPMALARALAMSADGISRE